MIQEAFPATLCDMTFRSIKRCFCCLLLISAPLIAQNAPTFKGHHLGESAQSFIGAEAVFRDKVASCRASAPKPLTPEQVHSLSKAEEYALSQQVFTSSQRSADSLYKWKSAPSRGQLEQMAREGRPVFFDRRLPQEIALCTGVLAAADQPDYSGTLSSPEVVPPVTWHFEHGQLTTITITTQGLAFPDVVADVTAKLGVQPTEQTLLDSETFIPVRRDQWITPSIFAQLDQRPSMRQQLIVMTRAEYDALAAAQNKKPSALD